MFYVVSYLLYFIVGVFVITIDAELISKTLRASNSTAIWVIIIQVILFSMMLIKRRSEYDFKRIKHDVVIECEKQMSYRRTHVHLVNWLFIILVYFTNSNISEFLPTWAFMLNNCLVFILVFITVYPLFIESNIEYMRTSWFNKLILPVSLYVLYLFFSGAYSTVLQVLNLGTDASGSVNQGLVEMLIVRDPIRMFFSVAIFAPIMEEWIFRGFGFRSLLSYNKIIAYISTFTLFGLVHLSAGFIGGAGLSEFIYLPVYGMMGVIYAYAYDRTGSIYSSMIIHGISNAIAFLVILTV